MSDGYCAHGMPVAAACYDCEAADPTSADMPIYGGRPVGTVVHDPAARGLIDWAEFWRTDRAVPEFIIPGLLPEGTAASLYSGAGVGKSLLSLEWAVCLATGQPILGEPCRPRHILIIDHEQDRDLLEDRLTALGVGPETDLSRLHYSLLGDWPPLDSPEGGEALVAAVLATGAELVIIDTISRAIAGEENPADTWLRLYRHTVRRLKGIRVAFLRLDHQGKDASKGERGSSAKRGDVDLTYRLDLVADGRLNLTRQKNRLHLPGPELVAVRRTAEPLRHVPVSVDLQHEVKIGRLLAAIDSLDLPEDAGRTTIGRELKARGIKVRTADLGTAIARRKAGPTPVPPYGGETVGTGQRSGLGTAGNRQGTGREQLSDESGNTHQSDLFPPNREQVRPTSVAAPRNPSNGAPPCVKCSGPNPGRYGPGGGPTCPACRKPQPPERTPS